jgi:hypothetical protein
MWWQQFKNVGYFRYFTTLKYKHYKGKPTPIVQSLMSFLQLSQKLNVSQLLFITYYWRKKEFEDTKGVIRIHKSKDRQHNGQKKKDKKRSTKHVHKTRDRVTHTLLKIWVNSGALEVSSNKCYLSIFWWAKTPWVWMFLRKK